MSDITVVLMVISCFVLCTAIMRIALDGKMNVAQQLDETSNGLDMIYSMMLFLCYVLVVFLGVFIITTNLSAVLVFLSFVLLWKSLDIKNHCLNSIVSYIKEKMKEE